VAPKSEGGEQAPHVFDRFGPYRVEGDMVESGLIVTLRAVHERLPRRVRIKTLRPTLSVDSPYAQQLEREAAILARVRHEGILDLYELVRKEDALWLVLEDPDGPTLAEVLASESGSKVTLEQAVAIALGVARALAVAHERGVTHRALCPSRVWLAKGGITKIGDFADAHDVRLPSSPVPFEGADTFGPPDYLAPEQILGESVGARSDVFALGVMLYEMLAGARPFGQGDASRDVAHRIRYVEPDSLRARLGDTFPKALDRVVLRALNKDPESRQPDARALYLELERAVPLSFSREVLVSRASAAAGFGEALSAPPATESAPGAPRAPSMAPLIRRLSLLALVMLGGGAAIVFAARDELDNPGNAGSESTPDARGYVKVLAQPWAEVLMDGELVDVTPIGRSIPVSPGRHFFTFRHPAAPDEKREIRVSAGQTVVLDVILKIERDAEAAPAPSSPEELSP